MRDLRSKDQHRWLVRGLVWEISPARSPDVSSNPSFDFSPIRVASLALNTRKTQYWWRDAGGGGWGGGKMSATSASGLLIRWWLFRVSDVKLVSNAAVFGSSRNAPPQEGEWEPCVTRQKRPCWDYRKVRSLHLYLNLFKRVHYSARDPLTVSCIIHNFYAYA